jgi:hypothetical protein
MKKKKRRRRFSLLKKEDIFRKLNKKNEQTLNPIKRKKEGLTKTLIPFIGNTHTSPNKQPPRNGIAG